MTRAVVVQGLAPSGSLAPSLTLAPQDTIYAGGPITPNAISMGIGVGGTYVDVSPWVEFGEGLTYTYGRQTQFDDTSPGTFSFTLNNVDGRFTPDNPTSPLATKVTEGMGVCWQLGTRLLHFTVLAVTIPADEATWDHLQVTCDDMLGTAGRHMLTTLADALVEHEGDVLLWKLDEPADSTTGGETHGDGLGGFSVFSTDPNPATPPVVFGNPAAPGLPGTTVTVTAAPGRTTWFGTRFGNTAVVTQVQTGLLAQGVSGGYRWWNLWVYPNSTINLAVTPHFATGAGYSYSMQIQATPTTFAVKAGTNYPFVYSMTAAEQQLPHYVSMRTQRVWQTSNSTWALFLHLIIDGVDQGSTYWYDPVNGYVIPNIPSAMSPVVVNVSTTTPAGATAPLSGTVQRVSSTTVYEGLENNALYNTLEQRRAVLDFVSDEISSATYNGPLSTEPIGFPDVSSSSVLDVYNDIARSEDGYLFCRTQGSLLNPVEQIQIRARDRPTTPSTTFDVTVEGSGLPAFIRDITNVAAQTDVQGPTTTVTVTDSTVKGRYITSGTSETVLYTAAEALREWGQDRLYRGRNIAVRAQTFTVDAMTTPTDRSTDLLARVPGDRIQLTNLPGPRLGFTTWDGWIIGGSETHTVNQNSFTFTLAPTIPTPGIADTDRFQDDSDVRLGSTYTPTATSMVFTPLDGTVNLSTDVPYTIQIDQEQLTVTAVSGSTMTVARGSNGTTPASHTVNSLIMIAPSAVYAY